MEEHQTSTDGESSAPTRINIRVKSAPRDGLRSFLAHNGPSSLVVCSVPSGPVSHVCVTDRPDVVRIEIPAANQKHANVHAMTFPA